MSSELVTSPTPSGQASKSQRTLACILCKQRKVKCDRKFPCATCVKSRTQCIPASLVQPRRRRRRFPERELLTRVRKYEDLLRQHNVAFEPLHTNLDGEKESPQSDSGSNLDGDHMDTEEVVSEGSALSPSDPPRKGLGASTIWQSIRLAAQDPHKEDDAFTEEARETAMKKAWESTADKADHLLFGLRKSTVDLSTSHPDPIHIFRLWQVYLDNVNPLLKVTHVPTLQSRIIEAAGNLTKVDSNLEALMFGIYSMAILSLDKEDCEKMFNSSGEDLLAKYQYNCQQALLNCAFLRTTDRDCLTALFLYLVSVRPSTIPPSLSPMLAVAVRIAQRMGIHSEALLTKCTPLEAEMRRRLWWALMLFDTRICELSNTTVMTLDPTWDCKMPLNVNDSDLRPEMKAAPTSQGQCTDAIFAVLRSEVAEFTRHAAFYLDFANPALRPIAKRLSGTSTTDAGELTKLENMIEDRYFKFCDPDNPIHYMTIWTTRGRIAKSRLLEHHSRSASSNLQQTEDERAIVNSHAIRVLECDTMIMKSPLVKRFQWLNLMYFPFPSYIHLSQDLRKHPTGKQAQQAWDAMSDSFDAWNIPLFGENLFFQAFTKVVLQAWNACEAAAKQSEDDPTPPRIVTTIKSLEEDRATQHPPNTVAEQFDMVRDFEAHDFAIPVTTSMNFASPTQAYNMGMPDQYPLMSPDMYTSMPAQAPFQPHLHRLAWNAFGGMPNWRF